MSKGNEYLSIGEYMMIMIKMKYRILFIGISNMSVVAVVIIVLAFTCSLF